MKCIDRGKSHRKERRMLNWIIDFSLRHRLLVILGVAWPGGCRRAVAALSRYRRLSRHDAGAGADQHGRAGARAGGSRAADHVPDRAGDRRAAGAGGDAERLEVRLFAGRRHVQGRHRHLLRPAARQRAAVDGRAGRRDRAAEDGAGRRRGWAKCSTTSSPARATTSPSCARSTTGSSSPRCGPCKGAAEINSWGGYEKQYQVRIDPNLLIKYGLTFDEVVQGRRREQPQRRRRQHPRRDAVGARAGLGPHDERRADRRHRHRGHGRRADSRERRGRGGDRLGDSPRRGDGRRQGRSRPGPGLHAHGREHARGHLGDEGPARRDQADAAAECRGRRRSTTAPSWSITSSTRCKNNLFEGGLLVIAVLFAFLGNLRAA